MEGEEGEAKIVNQEDRRLREWRNEDLGACVVVLLQAACVFFVRVNAVCLYWL